MTDAIDPRARQGGAGLSIDAVSLMRDGRRWFPVSGEYHFSRDVPERWEHELRKLKAGGVDLVATYVIWILHEERRGQRRWDGHLDVRRFVETARRAGLEVVLRVGPWAHGEARNGGFPDWLQELPIAHRTNDPAYLEHVRDWYADIASQLRGLFRDDAHPDAPIVAVQVDNELYDQPDHLATLRDIAEEAGMHAPFWVATGWGGAQVPQDALISVYGGYSDGFWDESDVELPDFSAAHFTFSDVRDDLSVGADVRLAPPTTGRDDGRFPFLTCELGGGMAVAYHRRPRVDAADIDALALTKLGSGSAWQGYYVYHGTVQPTGTTTGMQETQDSGYPNDLPRKDYDFYAPIGSAGTLRPHYHLLRAQHLFLQQWGAQLLELPWEFPDPAETGMPVSVRVSEGRGFVFGTNHRPAAAPADDVMDFQFALADGAMLPAAPTGIPAGTAFVWPVGQAYGDVLSLTGTVQPVTQIETDGGLVAIFRTTDGVPVELDIDSGGAAVSGARAFDTEHGPRWTLIAEPGPEAVITVGTTRLVILDAASGSRVWAGSLAGERFVALWDGGLTFADDHATLERWGTAREVLTIRALEGSAGRVGPFHHLALPAVSAPASLAVRQIAAATSLPETRRGGTADRYSAPRDAEYSGAAVFEIDVPVDDGFAGAQVVSLEWSGDVARAWVGDELVSDQFWYGRPWEIDALLLPQLATSPLRIEILPWNGDAEFFVDRRVRADRVAGRADVLSATLIRAPHHRLMLAPQP